MPLVRPDGRHGGDVRCFYCRQPVGQPHARECVQVKQLVEYHVRVGGASWDDLDGEIVGTFRRTDPLHWEPHDCEFHKNGSSWCADNALDAIVWNDSPAADRMLAKIEEIEAQQDVEAMTGPCCCSLLAFSFNRVVDPGPIDGQAEEAKHSVKMNVPWKKDVQPE